ncbi:DUF305 domain-containing protein [Catenuloplanes indicus]|uniref:Uncharacterized protein (DUF305 family) n=1 Tax=Catenuloplanes indicus TaxID=137267 RepID=A0AAE4AVQ4_9ACTN|nr:DUF305 domain-containing protein [Catenuloplanes indicus]MDQ0363916.1 uncharacterized protein (DUF305 family) [Catenuloplanes indicus]
MMRTSLPSATVLRRGLLAVAAVTAALALPACGGDHSATPGADGMDHTPASAPAAAPASAGTFNDADVSFAQSMIPHHQQAVQMAVMADGRAADSEVRTLAGKIRQAQQPEIDTMTGWLTAWGRPAPSMSMDAGMHHGSMPGMMSDADMATLTDATGTAFDKHFLTMMISHHEGAVEMAQRELADGASTDAKTLAQKIITDQQAEITTMRTILARL